MIKTEQLEDNHLFDYIVSFWFGPRRSKPHTELLREYKYTFLEAHCRFLENTLPINNVYFVVNGDCDYNKVMQVIHGFSIDYPIQCINRDNVGFSYGAWQAGLSIALENQVPQYAFLCEDDYIPVVPYFYKPFYNKFDRNTVYVASLFKANHAAISNGFIDYSKINKNRIFTLDGSNNSYGKAEQNQKRFLSHYRRYNVKDVKEHKQPFYDANVDKVLYYGGKCETLIEPIL